MKNNKITMFLVFFLFIFFGMSELEASTWTCTYKSKVPKLGGEKIIEYILYVDSETGLKTDNFEWKCEDGTTGSDSFSGKQLMSYTICGFGFWTAYFTQGDNLNQLNEKFKTNDGYGCTSTPLAFSSGNNVGHDRRYLSFYGTSTNYAFELSSAVNVDPEKNYTCGDGKLGTKGTCPEGMQCIGYGGSQNGGFACVEKTGNDVYDEVCPASSPVPREASVLFTRQCYNVQYVKNNGVYEPIVKYYSDGENCTGSLSSPIPSNFDSDKNQWVIVRKIQGSEREDSFILPAVSSCEEVPKDIKFGKNNVASTNVDDPQIKPGQEMKCEDLISDNGKIIIKLGILAIRILAPVLLFTFTAYEFMKAIPQQDDDAIIKAWKRFGTRGIVTAIIMLLPTLLNVLGMITGVFDNCGIW